MKWISAIVVSLTLALSVEAQHSMPHSSGTPVPLESGLSDNHHPVSTSNAEAQRYFDQGLRYVYAFNHDAAIASFQRATELDPDLAMGYWGMALALGPNINLDVDAGREVRAFDLVRLAADRAPRASEKERALIEALGRRYSNNPDADLKALNADYSRAMADVHRRYPDDADIATLYAESLMNLRPWKFWAADGTPAEGTNEIVRVLEGVLADAPQHLGANHYYIHAIEASKNPARATKSAERLQTLAPAAGHLVHMPAHIFQRTGQYAAAARANENGAKADREFIRKYGQTGIYPMMYYNHNLHFGAFSHAAAGNYADARRLADEVGKNAQAMAKDMADIDPMAATPLLIALRFGRWADVLLAPDPAAGPLSTAFWHFGRGVAFAQLGNVSGAEREQKTFEAARNSFAESSMMMQNSPRKLGEVASHVLAGRIAGARNEWPAAIASYRRAIEAEDTLNYNEPSDWYYPVRETLGAVLLRSGDSAGAAQIFREDLDRNPLNPRSLFGLAQALGDTPEAAKVRAQYRKSWSGSPLTVRDL